MAELIDSCESVDTHLAASVDKAIETHLMLQDVQIGSLKTFLYSAVKQVDDDALKNLNLKRMLGGFLLKGKQKYIQHMDDHQTIARPEDVEKLQSEISNAADESGISRSMIYTPVSMPMLLQDLSAIARALEHLQSTDTAALIIEGKKQPMNTGFRINSEQIEDILTRDTITNTAEMILQVKKPDMLGDSMWELVHDRRILRAKIKDESWLSDYHDRKVLVRPGDAIKAVVTTDAKYGFDGQVIAIRYTIDHVTEVIPFRPGDQISLI